jgi:hypothetical protein
VLAAGLPRSQRDLGVERDDDADLREGKHLIRLVLTASRISHFPNSS